MVMVLPSLLIRTQPSTPKPGFSMQIPTKSSPKYCSPNGVLKSMFMAASEAIKAPEATDEALKIISVGSWLAMMFIATLDAAMAVMKVADAARSSVAAVSAVIVFIADVLPAIKGAAVLVLSKSLNAGVMAISAAIAAEEPAIAAMASGSLNNSLRLAILFISSVKAACVSGVAMAVSRAAAFIVPSRSWVFNSVPAEVWASAGMSSRAVTLQSAAGMVMAAAVSLEMCSFIEPSSA